jgi:hypothetical protein
MGKRKAREIPLVWANDPISGVDVAAHSNARPTREALRQGEFDKGWTVGREVGSGFRRVDSLTTAHRNGTITDDMLAAGLRFRAMFDRAQLQGLRVRFVDPMPRASTGGHGLTIGESTQDARDRVARVIARLGGQGAPMAEVAWWVVGLGLGVEEYATRARWNGRPLNAKSVTGLMIGALSLIGAMRRTH